MFRSKINLQKKQNYYFEEIIISTHKPVNLNIDQKNHHQAKEYGIPQIDYQSVVNQR